MRVTRLLVGVAVVSLLGACSSSASPSPPQASPTPAVAAIGVAVAATPAVLPAPATAVPSPAESPSASAAADAGSVVDVTAVSLGSGGGFAVDAAGDIYTPTGTDGFALVELAPDGTVLAHWAGTDVISGEPDTISDVVLDPASGDVFALDATADQVVHLSPDLQVLGTFGGTGDGPGQFSDPAAIAFDPSGHLLVVDTGNNRIETFSRDGTLVSTWDAPGGAMWPFGLAVDAHGDLVVSGGQPYDQTTNAAGQVIVFSPDRTPLLTLKLGAIQPLAFPDAAVDPAGDILVQDGSGEILTFSPTGTLVTRRRVWPKPSPDAVQVARSGVVRVAPSGQVYSSGCVGSHCRIVEVGPDGATLRTWDSTRPADHPGSKVATGRGYGLYLQCAGTGSPTVVWEAGSVTGGSSDLPPYLLGRLAAITRVCLYDRAGLGLSDTAPYEVNAGGAQMIADLHAVLQEAGVPGPYVMVGYSLGGLLTRLFAATYPREVAGVVQVDGLSEDVLPNAGCTDTSCPFHSTATAMRAAIHDTIPGSLGALPLVVLTHDPAFPPWGASLDPVWQTTQQAIATASSNAVHVDATWSSHLIASAAPGLVVEAVREVVAAVRATDHALPRCGAAFTRLGGTRR
jgi:pimeloyl-ACP methyl ester carboxylesterase/sugar lactone lactonase YvrE